MRARIYNKSKNTYYISEVYGVINRAGDWYIVDDIDNNDRVILVEYLDFTTKPPYQVNVETIDANPLHNKWIFLDDLQENSINQNLIRSKKLHYFRGYECIWNSTEALIELLENGSVLKSKLSIGNVSTKLKNWNYIETQADIDSLMNEYKGFHDSILKELSYVSGEYVDNEKRMYLKSAGSKQVKLVYNSDWAKEIEIILLSPRIVHLIPAEENYMSVLYETSILIKDCAVYFFDSNIDKIPDEYTGTYFKSMGMMWRYT